MICIEVGMKLKEWLKQTPIAVPGVTTNFDIIVIKELYDTGLDKMIPENALTWYITAKVHLLHMLLDHGMPEDLEEVYHGENIV